MKPYNCVDKSLLNRYIIELLMLRRLETKGLFIIYLKLVIIIK